MFRCAVVASIPAGKTMTFVCGGMEGRFVNVVIPGQKKVLTLCEVDVLGTETDEDGCYSNTATPSPAITIMHYSGHFCYSL